MGLIADLKKPREIDVGSDAALGKQIAMLPNGKVKGTLKAVVGLPIGSQVVKPIDLLLALGRATTPPVPAILTMSSRWAVLRYVWAFAASKPAPAVNRLRLSEDTRFLRLHQRSLFAEDMGVALTHYFLRKALETRHPGRTIFPADAEYALWVGQAVSDVAGTPAATVGILSNRFPDHLWVVVDAAGTGVEAVYASESKATHYGPAAARRRMADGCAQITSIGAVVGGTWTPVEGFVFGASLNRRRIRLQAIDPEGLDLRGDLPPLHRGRDRKPAVRLEGSRASITDAQEFRAAVIDTARAQFLSFGGEHEVAADLVRVPAGGRPAEGGDAGAQGRLDVREEPAERSFGGRPQRGTRITASLEGGEQLEAFFGTDREVRDAIVRADLRGEIAARAQVRHARQALADSPDDEAVATSFLDDGSVLQITRR